MFHALKDSLQHSKKRFNEFRVTVLILLVVILLQFLRIHNLKNMKRSSYQLLTDTSFSVYSLFPVIK